MEKIINILVIFLEVEIELILGQAARIPRVIDRDPRIKVTGERSVTSDLKFQIYALSLFVNGLTYDLGLLLSGIRIGKYHEMIVRPSGRGITLKCIAYQFGHLLQISIAGLISYLVIISLEVLYIEEKEDPVIDIPGFILE